MQQLQSYIVYWKLCLVQSSDPKCELSGDWRCKFDESPELEQAGNKSDAGQPVQGDKNVSSYCGASLSEDNDALTESKIRAFLAEKVLLLIFNIEDQPFPSAVLDLDSLHHNIQLQFDFSGFGTEESANTFI